MPHFAFAAVALDSAGSGATGGSTPLSYSHTVSGSNTILICSAAYAPGGGGVSISGITFNSVALTSLSSQISDAIFAKTEMWYLLNPATGAHTATATFTGNPDRRHLIARALLAWILPRRLARQP